MVEYETLSEQDLTHWHSLQNSIAEDHPSLGANLSDCELKKVGSNHFEFKAIRNDYTLRVIEGNIELLGQRLRDIIGAPVEISFEHQEEDDGI